ncbi:hypothetical protein MUCCIDRAFT_158643 [Mucor lusitanicus CBS 277.49]|uniref:Uncharacterized protein n=1 Tax=Mucor lusitanicus CBS 277.49 TaxID=747725 RepID=A0A168PYS8_MUCCL|nr:hypothetical protein MUCCIDRAFT_158643 [Mucor lusitanicus CBS 277.49]
MQIQHLNHIREEALKKIKKSQERQIKRLEKKTFHPRKEWKPSFNIGDVVPSDKEDKPQQDKFKIKGLAKKTALSQKQAIKKKVRSTIEDIKTIKKLEARRARYLAEILPYIRKHLQTIYLTDNEPLTYHQLKNEFIKDLFPDDASAIAFKRKYLKH